MFTGIAAREIAATLERSCGRSVPLESGNVFTASTLMNWFYKPTIAAEVADYVNYISPVAGADKILLKQDPAVAKNPLIFPTQAMLEKTHQIDPKSVNNQTYKQQFQHLIGA